MKQNTYVMVKQCSSATCQGSEIGCGNGDCWTSKHHRKNVRWRKWTLRYFEKIFEENQDKFQSMTNHKITFHLEVGTSADLTPEEFCQELLLTETRMNRKSLLRFHIKDDMQAIFREYKKQYMNEITTG